MEKVVIVYNPLFGDFEDADENLIRDLEAHIVQLFNNGIIPVIKVCGGLENLPKNLKAAATNIKYNKDK